MTPPPKPLECPEVYLLHLDGDGFGHAKHYLGWTVDLGKRLRCHGKPRGARMLLAAAQAGIRFTCVRTWRGDRALERRLKRQKNSRRFCPICNPTTWRNCFPEVHPEETSNGH